MSREFSLFIGPFSTLLAIINPFEALPVYLKLLEGKDNQTHRQVAWKSCGYADAFDVRSRRDRDNPWNDIDHQGIFGRTGVFNSAIFSAPPEKDRMLMWPSYLSHAVEFSTGRRSRQNRCRVQRYDSRADRSAHCAFGIELTRGAGFT
jgi:hypothetical protein